MSPKTSGKKPKTSGKKASRGGASRKTRPRVSPKLRPKGRPASRSAASAGTDRRVGEIAARLQRMVDEDHPLSGVALNWFRTMLAEWEEPGSVALPPPFGESPLLGLVASMLPSVDAQDPDSGAMIRTLIERVRVSPDAEERRQLGLSLEWFYLYFTRKTDLDFIAWVKRRRRP